MGARSDHDIAKIKLRETARSDKVLRREGSMRFGIRKVQTLMLSRSYQRAKGNVFDSGRPEEAMERKRHWRNDSETEVTSAAEDRIAWRQRAYSLILYQENGQMMMKMMMIIIINKVPFIRVLVLKTFSSKFFRMVLVDSVFMKPNFINKA